MKRIKPPSTAARTPFSRGRRRALGGPRPWQLFPRPWQLVVLGAAGVAVASLASGGTARSVRAARLASACTGPPPRVVFPQSSPFRRSGAGALLWDASPGGRCVSVASADDLRVAPILASDALGASRTLVSGATGVETAAATTRGQVIAAVRTTPSGGGAQIPALTEGVGDGAFSPPQPLSDAIGPVASATGYLGDAALAWVTRAPAHARQPGRGTAIVLALQRHFASAPRLQGRYPIAAGQVSALTVALDYRSDALLTWVQAGWLRARFVPAAGAPGPIQTLGASTATPPLTALVSDDGRAIVAWISQHTRVGQPATANVYMTISRPGVRFAAPRLVTRFIEPAAHALPATAIALVRLSTESVTMAWTGLGSGGHYVVRSAPVGLGGVGPATALSDPSSDALLSALAPGPRGDAIAVWTVPSASGSASVAGRLLVPSFTRDRLGPLLTLAPPGPYADPAAALDPDSDRALVAWRADDQPSGIESALVAPFGASPAGAAPVP